MPCHLPPDPLAPRLPAPDNWSELELRHELSVSLSFVSIFLRSLHALANMAWLRFESYFHSIDAFATWYHVYIYICMYIITKIERIRKKHWFDTRYERTRFGREKKIRMLIFSWTNSWKYDKDENRKISLSTERGERDWNVYIILHKRNIEKRKEIKRWSGQHRNLAHYDSLVRIKAIAAEKI